MLPIAGAVLILMWGCAPSVHTNFHPTDPKFAPTPGPPPRVYVESSLADVPRSKMRSVGIIEVIVPERKGLEHAMELAVKRGRELGCWLLIEHAAFEKLQSRASLGFGAAVTLAHGPPPTAKRVGGPSTKLRAEFDCIVQAPDGLAA